MTTTKHQGEALALVRISLGVTILATWADNVANDLYTGDGLRGLLTWLATEAPNGNGGSLGFVHSLLDSIVAPQAGVFAFAQLVVELLFGIGLLLGLFTRLSSLLAAGFFLTLLLAYFGGEEWIWTYVILLAGAVAVFIGYAGRTWGLDGRLFSGRRSPASLLW